MKEYLGRIFKEIQDFEIKFSGKRKPKEKLFIEQSIFKTDLKEAEEGNIEAQVKVALHFLSCRKENYCGDQYSILEMENQALKWFGTAAFQQDRYAQNMFVRYALFGLGLTPFYNDEVLREVILPTRGEYIFTSLAWFAESGNVQSQIMLAEFHMNELYYETIKKVIYNGEDFDQIKGALRWLNYDNKQ